MLFGQATTYDAVGNVEAEAIRDKIDAANPSVTHSYTYDFQHRLTRDQDSSAPGGDALWSLDKVGNWEQSNQNGSAEVFDPNDDNEYEHVGPAGQQKDYTYDARGNLTHIGDPGLPADGDQRFTYDWANRLVQAEVYDTSGGGSWIVQAEYEYDALNRRVAKRVGPTLPGVGGQLILFAYDGSRVAFEMTINAPVSYRAAATMRRSFAYGPYIDEPAMIVDQDSGVIRYYLHDRRYSVVALADASGNVVERCRYQAYGRMTVYQKITAGVWISRAAYGQPNQSAYNNPYSFTGRRYDPETATSTSGGGASGGAVGHYRSLNLRS